MTKLQHELEFERLADKALEHLHEAHGEHKMVEDILHLMSACIGRCTESGTTTEQDALLLRAGIKH